MEEQLEMRFQVESNQESFDIDGPSEVAFIVDETLLRRIRMAHDAVSASGGEFASIALYSSIPDEMLRNGEAWEAKDNDSTLCISSVYLHVSTHSIEVVISDELSSTEFRGNTAVSKFLE